MESHSLKFGLPFELHTHLVKRKADLIRLGTEFYLITKQSYWLIITAKGILVHMNSISLIQGDSLTVIKSLPSNSVHCVITSPPYWGLRNYGVDGQIGLEPSFDEFLDLLVELFREIKRVLHGSGIMFVNMGDSYNSDLTRGHFGNQYKKRNEPHGVKRNTIKKLHPKNLLGQAWRLAFALQDDGWILRSDIIWHKPNPMPESVTDRPTRAHEYLFLFSKSGSYFYDADAIREPQKTFIARAPGPKAQNIADKLVGGKAHSEGGFNSRRQDRGIEYNPLGKNRQSVWTIPTQPFEGAHFATYPIKLVEPCVKAGTSEKGCCPKCLAPWHKLKEKDELIGSAFRDGPDNTNNSTFKVRKRADAPGAEVSAKSIFRTGIMQTYKTVGWAPSCSCDAGEPIPCTVLDPFSGSGTTALVAARHFRSAIGIELNPEYLEMARNRIASDLPLFNSVEVSRHIIQIETK
jgi:DNA modification methylase